MNGYLIPANSKKGTLILNLFREIDLIILGIGVGISLFSLMFIDIGNLFIVILCLLPALIAIFLVIPIPNYHNVLCAIQSILDFYTNRRKYVWRGWCFYENFTREDSKGR